MAVVFIFIYAGKYEEMHFSVKSNNFVWNKIVFFHAKAICS